MWKEVAFDVWGIDQGTDVAVLVARGPHTLEALPYRTDVTRGTADTLIGAGCVKNPKRVQVKYIDDERRACGCSGDSGGPMLLDGVVVGSLSAHAPADRGTRVYHRGLSALGWLLPPR